MSAHGSRSQCPSPLFHERLPGSVVDVLADAPDREFSFINEHKDSEVMFVSTLPRPNIALEYEKKRHRQCLVEIIDLSDFIAVKGWRATGNRLCFHKVISVKPHKLMKSEAEHVADPISPQDGETAQSEEKGIPSQYSQSSFLELDF